MMSDKVSNLDSVLTFIWLVHADAGLFVTTWISTVIVLSIPEIG
jgi:hypothetical protein